MFFGNTFRQLPIGLLILAGIFALTSQLIGFTSTGEFVFAELIGVLLAFVFLALIALTHSLRLENGGHVSVSLLGILKKQVRRDEPLEINVKPAFWSNYSRTLTITSRGANIFRVNIHDMGIDPNKNAKDFILRLMKHRKDIRLSSTVESFLEGQTDIYGRSKKDRSA